MRLELIQGHYGLMRNGDVAGPFRKHGGFDGNGLRFSAEYNGYRPMWNDEGEYCSIATIHRSLDIVRTCQAADIQEARRILLTPKPWWEVTQDNLSDLIDAAIKKLLCDKAVIADAIRMRDATAAIAPDEQQPVAERTWQEVFPHFAKYYRSPIKYPALAKREHAFLAGYNAALKNESCLRNRPSENAEGGQSGSEHPNDMPFFNIGFKGTDLSRLNPVVRKFFDSFAVANDAEFVGLAFLPNGRCVAELQGKTDIRHIELKGWLGMMWPEIADVVEPATPYQASAHPAAVHQILDESGQGSGRGVEEDFETAINDLKATVGRFLRSDPDQRNDRADRCKSKLIAMGLDPKVSAITTMEELHTFRAWLENEIRMEADL